MNHNSTIFLQDSPWAICGMHNFKLIYMVLYLYNVCNVYNKNMRIYIYKQIMFSVIVSVEYKDTNTNLQGKNHILVFFFLFLFFIC